ncbi:MAG: hypothetical protein IPG98_01310 [Burkholderiales bacterium]|nr:hypothetical protein [Burkholderiales bacterium]MBK8667481.1 hypothetical protein [Burkholderiales bacterium]
MAIRQFGTESTLNLGILPLQQRSHTTRTKQIDDSHLLAAYLASDIEG